eukprot:Skav208144  [mRNA]  locus=scaffold235:94237:94647:+ [translate_table: standard]
MGCSSSHPTTNATGPKPSKSTSKERINRQHYVDPTYLSGDLMNVEEPFAFVEKLEDPTSSWEVHEEPKGYPANMLLPPDKKLHDKHVKKLNRFLKKMQDSPSTLSGSVDEKRSKSGLEETARSDSSSTSSSVAVAL